MNKKLFKSIILTAQVGTITLFGILYHKLKKGHNKLKINYNDLSSIETVAKIKDNTTAVDLTKIKRQNIRKIIEDFYYKLEKDPNVDLTNFKKNLQTLKVKSIKEFEGDSSFAEALYDYYNNTIYYSILVKPRVLGHELLHMASTVYDEEAKYVRFVGFGQDKHNKKIGIGLTEGYTELLAKRYFGDINKKDTSDSYVTEMDLVNSLEKIIGKEKMMKLYFRGDLKSLVNELKKYNDIEKIIEFIHSIDKIALDTVNGYNYLTKREYNNYLVNAVEFLIASYVNKLQTELNENKIDNDLFMKKIEEFTNDLNNFDYIKYGIKHRIQLLNKKNLFNILKKVLGSEYISLSTEKENVKC